MCYILIYKHDKYYYTKEGKILSAIFTALLNVSFVVFIWISAALLIDKLKKNTNNIKVSIIP
ncbi:hypothetical protein [Methanobrevibacter arboriphilus]|uniref:hypothetical protein n=1 Tax=Methanobrevibacter arboriphilus TaxID=39441 RepID=UPI00117ED578|nr:hypothetical protein [Methanobrevibacter arboriphilus]